MSAAIVSYESFKAKRDQRPQEYFAFKAGFTYKFGKKSKSDPVETASLNAAALSASSKVEQTKLKAQDNDLNQKLALMEKKLEVITASLNLDSHMDKVAMAR